jgi:hypothetical protein
VSAGTSDGVVIAEHHPRVAIVSDTRWSLPGTLALPTVSESPFRDSTVRVAGTGTEPTKCSVTCVEAVVPGAAAREPCDSPSLSPYPSRLTAVGEPRRRSRTLTTSPSSMRNG